MICLIPLVKGAGLLRAEQNGRGRIYLGTYSLEMVHTILEQDGDRETYMVSMEEYRFGCNILGEDFHCLFCYVYKGFPPILINRNH